MILPIVLTLIGFLIVLAEVFFPSMGMFGLMAAAAIVTADVLAYEESQTFMWCLIAAQVIVIPFLVQFAFKVLPSLPFAKGMVLPEAPPETESAIEPAGHLVGRKGTALSDLRPSGTALVDGERRSVVAESGTVDQGTPVVVTAVEGYRIVVKALP